MEEEKKSNKKLTITIIVLGLVALFAAIFMSVKSEQMIVAPGDEQSEQRIIIR